MSVIVLVVLVFFALAAGLGGVAYLTYKRKLRRAKAIERGLKMVPILIHLPPPSSDTTMGNRDLREVMREKTAQAEVLYNLIAGTATAGIKSKLYGQRQLALELVATGGVVHFYAAVPVALVSVVKQAILTAYPGATLEETEDHNIFNQEGRLAATMGGEMVLRTEGAYPIATYKQLERDPMEAILTTLSTLTKQDGVAIQFMLRPADPTWVKRSIMVATAKRKGRNAGLAFTPKDLLEAALRAPNAQRETDKAGGVPTASNLELAAVEQIEEKTKHPGFDVLIRVVVSTDSVVRSQQQLRDLATAFALFDAPGLNGFKFLPALDVQGLVTAFIFRFFPPELKGGVLASEELATLFHLPDSQFTPSAGVERMQSKQVDGPVAVPAVGLLFGYNEFRGVHKDIRLSVEDRRRHTYILGQTGTGKSTMLENLAVQDMMSGNGFAFIDPHGDSAEKLLALVPKERAEDVIYFNPADTEYPVGLNLFEFNDPTQKDFIVQETINMLYKLYDPGHTGIIGPRYEHWYRNAALTLMSDPNGSTFIEIPKVFTDTEYLKQKFRYLTDPTVIDFWTKEMGQTSDYHKSEMLGWFVSKFGAFMNNEMMRNIIGQTQSAFNLRDVMDHKRILIVNLSKGRIGELNSQLLGMIFVIKFQAAAMSRAEVPEDQRPDFSLYVDEFQNFSTDSFASILSEARKYRLNLIVANQFIGQLRPEVRDAVFGNIGTIVAHRMGPDDAEFMVKQFAPVFDAGDLVNIPNYNAAMRLMIGGLPSQPFTIRDSAPLGSPNLALGLAIKQLSAAKFGHAKAQVERDILARMSGGAPAAPAPVAPVAVGESVGAQGSSTVVAPGEPVGALPLGASGAPVGPPPQGAVAPAPVASAPTAMPGAPGVIGAGGVAGQFGPGLATGGGGVSGGGNPGVASAPPLPEPFAAMVNSVPGAGLAAPAGPAGAAQPTAAAVVPVPGSQFGPPGMGAPPILATGGPESAAVPVGAQAAVPAAASVMPPAPVALASAPVQAAKPVDAARTLALTDITGGKPPMRPVAPPAPEPSLELGRPSAGDPYANLAVLGPAAAPPVVAEPPRAQEAPMAVAPVAPAPLDEAPESVVSQQPEAPAAPPVAAAPVAAMEPEPLQASQPVDNSGLLAAPAAAPSVSPAAEPEPRVESLIHFVDPAAQALLERPEPDARSAANDGLPEGVIFVDQPPQPRDMAASLAAPADLLPTAPPIAVSAPAAAVPAPSSAAIPPPPAAAPSASGTNVPELNVSLAQALEEQLAAAPAAAPSLSAQPSQQSRPVTTVALPEPAPAAGAIEAPEAPAVAPAAEAAGATLEPSGAAPVMGATEPPIAALRPESVIHSEPPAPVAESEPVPAAKPAAAKSAGPVPVAAKELGVPGPVGGGSSQSQSQSQSQSTPLPVEPAIEPPAPQPSLEPVQAEASSASEPEFSQPVSPASAPVSTPVSSAPPVSEAPAVPPPSAAPSPAVPPASTPTPSPAPAPMPADTVAPTSPPPAAASVPLAVAEAPVSVSAPQPEAPAASVSASSPEPVASELTLPSPPAPESAVAQAPASSSPTPAPAAPMPPPADTPPQAPLAPPQEQPHKPANQISGLLDTSLLDSGKSTRKHRRLPEPAPVAVTESEDQDLGYGTRAGGAAATAYSASRPSQQPKTDQRLSVQHHGLKVINPLQPIGSKKEELAHELAAIAESERQEAESAPVAEVAEVVKPAPPPPVVPEPVKEAPPPPKPEQRPAPPQILKHSEQMMGLPPAPPSSAASSVPAAAQAPVSEFDDLPQAESLAADDVAEARAKRQPEQVPAPVTSATPAPAVKLAAQEPAPPKPDNQTSSHSGNRNKRRHGGHGRFRNGESVKSTAEAEHNSPTEVEEEAGSLTGKLIMPTAQKPAMELEPVKVEKPKKLAPGEVFVDDNGNVVIGE